MMTDRRITLSLATAFALIAFTMAPANADEGPAAAKPAANVRTAANLDVPASRASKAASRIVRLHHRKVATTGQRSVAAPAGLVRVAYRPVSEAACGGVCRSPIVLFIGITY